MIPAWRLSGIHGRVFTGSAVSDRISRYPTEKSSPMKPGREMDLLLEETVMGGLAAKKSKKIGAEPDAVLAYSTDASLAGAIATRMKNIYKLTWKQQQGPFGIRMAFITQAGAAPLAQQWVYSDNLAHCTALAALVAVGAVKKPLTK